MATEQHERNYRGRIRKTVRNIHQAKEGGGMTRQKALIDYVQCPGCGDGNLSDNNGFITCDNCDFHDNMNEEKPSEQE